MNSASRHAHGTSKQQREVESMDLLTTGPMLSLLYELVERDLGLRFWSRPTRIVLPISVERAAAWTRSAWLNTPYPRLGNDAPLAALLSGRAEEVARMLAVVRDGGVPS